MQKAGGIKFSNGKTLQAYMEKSQEFIAHSKELVTMLETKVSEIEQVIAELKAQVKRYQLQQITSTTFKLLPGCSIS